MPDKVKKFKVLAYESDRHSHPFTLAEFHTTGIGTREFKDIARKAPPKYDLFELVWTTRVFERTGS